MTNEWLIGRQNFICQGKKCKMEKVDRFWLLASNWGMNIRVKITITTFPTKMKNLSDLSATFTWALQKTVATTRITTFFTTQNKLQKCRQPVKSKSWSKKEAKNGSKNCQPPTPVFDARSFIVEWAFFQFSFFSVSKRKTIFGGQ